MRITVERLECGLSDTERIVKADALPPRAGCAGSPTCLTNEPTDALLNVMECQNIMRCW